MRGEQLRQLSETDISSASIVAHEMRAPLALIRQLTLELGDANVPAADRALILKQIRLTSEQALRFSSNIAKAERLQADLFPNEPLSVASLCRQVVAEVSPLYTAHGRKISTKRMHTQAISANRDLLHRVIANFVDNALRYGDEKSVVELYTELLRKDDKLRVGVRSRTTTQTTSAASLRDSHGLGLIIAHRFAELCGGEIGAVRHRDGASFYVELSLSKQLSLL